MACLSPRLRAVGALKHSAGLNLSILRSPPPTLGGMIVCRPPHGADVSDGM